MRSPRCSALAATAVLAVLAGCTSSGTRPAADPSSAALTGTLPAHVHGVAIDPRDETLLLATHEGLVEVSRAGQLASVGPVIDLMGFAVVGVDHYLGSGHPGLQVVELPNPVGLIESTDGGETWSPLSRAGESDFHALTPLDDAGVLGYDGVLRRSADGRTWEQLTIPAPPHTLAAARDGSTVLATTQQRLLRSVDAGTSWSQVAGAPVLQVVTWADDTTTIGVDPVGTVWVSTDAAASWREAARLGAAPHAVDAATAGDGTLRIAVVTDEGLLESRDGGRTFTVLLAQ